MVGRGSIDHLDLLVQNNNNTTRDVSVFRTTLWNETSNKYKVRHDVYIKFGSNHGPLTVNRTAGYANPNDFGPEVMFGWTITDSLKNMSIMTGNDIYTADPIVLLLKVAYGRRSLAIDFRPPSAGLGNYSVDPTAYGLQYRIMMNDTITALQTIGDYIPNYDSTMGYEVSGFVWFQGWGDVLDWDKVNEYESNLVHFMRDVRKDLGISNLPFGTL